MASWSPQACPVPFGRRAPQGFQCWAALLAFEAHSLPWGLSCHCREVRSIPGLYPLDTRKIPQLRQPEMSPDTVKCPPGGNVASCGTGVQGSEKMRRESWPLPVSPFLCQVLLKAGDWPGCLSLGLLRDRRACWLSCFSEA